MSARQYCESSFTHVNSNLTTPMHMFLDYNFTTQPLIDLVQPHYQKQQQQMIITTWPLVTKNINSSLDKIMLSCLLVIIL